jgi:hypothetical protein
MIPFFVDENGRPLVFDKPKMPTPEVETKEPTLAEIAEKEAAKQSTKVKETKWESCSGSQVETLWSKSFLFQDSKQHHRAMGIPIRKVGWRLQSIHTLQGVSVEKLSMQRSRRCSWLLNAWFCRVPHVATIRRHPNFSPTQEFINMTKTKKSPQPANIYDQKSQAPKSGHNGLEPDVEFAGQGALDYDHDEMLNSPTRSGLQPKGKK